MPTLFRILVVLVIALGLTAANQAQEPASQEAAGEKAAVFEKRFAEWTGLLDQLRALKAEYIEAGSARKSDIVDEYSRLVEKGEGMQKGLVTAALDAAPEMPELSDDLINFLHDYLAWSVEHDDYEFALMVGKTLIERGTASPDAYVQTAQAAFCTNDFALAQTYYDQARDLGAFDPDRFREIDEATIPRVFQVAKTNLENMDYYKEAWAEERKIREAEAEADDLPRVLLKTKHGDIVVELFENEAPNTVANFISLVEDGYYDGLTFHRVIPGFMAQGGCPLGTGGGGPGYTIEDECDRPDYRKHFRGTLSMAKSAQPDTGGSQFFLTFVPTRHLDTLHTAFGRVVEGMEVLAKIKRRTPEQAIEADRIIEAKVLRKRDHDYEPVTHPEEEPGDR